MTDKEVWLILVNGLAAQGESAHIVAEDADRLLIEYKKRWDVDHFEAGNDGESA